MRRRAAARAPLAALAGAPGCGYALVGTGVTVDPSIKRIGVPLFKDTTGKPGLDQKITQKVIEELLKRGRFDVVQRARRASTPWSRASSLPTTRRPVGFSGDGASADASSQASRYAITLTARVRYAKVGRDGADLVERLVLLPRRVRRRLRPRARSSTARSRPSSACPRRSRAAWWPRCWRPSDGDGRGRAGVHADRGRRLATWPSRRSRACCEPRGRASARTRSQVLRGDETTWARVLDAARTGSLFAPRRAVVVRNAEALKGEGEERRRPTSTTPRPDAALVLMAAKPDKRKSSGSALLDRGAGGPPPSR